MTRELTLRRDNLLLCLALSLGATAALFWYQGNKGFSLWDEGFLWYGVQRVLLGEVPIRDFMAYDPGRYYWSAWIMQLFLRNDILSLRIAATAIQALGLFIGLLAIVPREKNKRFLFLFLSAFALLLWMFPYYKTFDTSLSILLVASLAFLIRNPNGKRYFVSGIILGLIAVFGRNHGVYGVAASLGVMIWLQVRRQEHPRFFKGFALWGSGVVIGFSPILFMAVLIPGFAEAFWQSVRFITEVGATNIPRPIPWPWAVDFAALSPVKSLREVLIGFGFVGLLAFGVGALIWSFRERLRDRPASPTLVASAFLALPYAHYAFSRADIQHLAMGIFPLLLGVLTLLVRQPERVKWSLLLVLCICSFIMTRDQRPWLKSRATKTWVEIEVSGNTLKVDPVNASEIELLRKLTEQYAPNGQNVLILPFWPGAYALLERKSPTWEIYALFNRPRSFEELEVARIKAANPQLVFLLDYKLDGRDDLRFQNTHPMMFRYISETYSPIEHELNPTYMLFKSK